MKVFYLDCSMPNRVLLGMVLLSAALSGCGARNISSVGPVISQSASQAPQLLSVLPENGRASMAAEFILQPGSDGYASLVLADKPMAYYQLNDTTPQLVDSGPYRTTGTYGSSVIRGVTPITKSVVSSAAFPGGSGYNANGFAYTPPKVNLQPATLTVEAWFKLTAPNATNHDLPIVAYGSSSQGVSYGMYMHGLGNGQDSIIYEQRNVGQNSSLLLLGTTRLAVGATYHLVAVSDGTNVRTYINGVQDVAAHYPGAVYYPNQNANGLNIGGQYAGNPKYGSAPFPGTVAQVAIYSQALPQTGIVKHFLAGQLIPMTTEAATPSDAFVDSIGVNAHFENHYTQYVSQYSQVKSLLINSGIRHIRVGMLFGNSNYYNMMQDLGRWGIRGDYLTQLTYTQSQITQFPSLVYPSFEQYEAPNEQDQQSNPNWIGPCRAFQQHLYSWVKGNSNTKNYPVLGPSLIKSTSFAALGDVSAYMDKGNMHNYFSFFNPGTLGWGSKDQYGVYGSLSWNMNMVRITSPNRPMMTTETGYGTVPGNPMTLDNRAQMRYMSRLFFQQYMGGVNRSYSYEFLDEAVGGSAFNDFGLVQTNLTPKPAYTAIQSIIGSLKDPGAWFTTKPLTYQIAGFVNNVHHLLLQRRDGSYVLAVWLEVSDWNAVNNVGGDIIVSPQTVTLTTAPKFSSADIQVMNDAGGFSRSAIPWSGQNGSFNVTDKITLVTLKP